MEPDFPSNVGPSHQPQPVQKSKDQKMDLNTGPTKEFLNMQFTEKQYKEFLHNTAEMIITDIKRSHQRQMKALKKMRDTQ